jgi:hypothetical protein
MKGKKKLSLCLDNPKATAIPKQPKKPAKDPSPGRETYHII